jgi:hypothetical protein
MARSLRRKSCRNKKALESAIIFLQEKLHKYLWISCFKFWFYSKENTKLPKSVISPETIQRHNHSLLKLESKLETTVSLLEATSYP